MNNNCRLCFSTLGCSDRSLEQILTLCADYGIELLEIRGIGGELDNRLIADFADDALAETLGKLRRAGVRPLVLGTSCSFDSAENFGSAVSEGRAALLTAKALGAGAIRVFGNNLGTTPAENTRRVIDGLRRLCTYSENGSVDVLLEVHGDFNTLPTLEPVLEAMKNEHRFGLIWDICHTHAPYGDNWAEFYEGTKEFIRHVHIKDVKNGQLVLPGDGELPIKPIIQRLASDGYSGAFSLEWEKKWHPELEEIEAALERFLKITGEI